MDHTAELGLSLESASERGVYEEALRALAELLDGVGAGAPVSYAVELAAADRPALLVAWLEELLFHAETGGLVPEAVESLTLDGTALRARVRARRGDPRHLVKAVTYHDLRFARSDDGRWSARLVLDV